MDNIKQLSIKRFNCKTVVMVSFILELTFAGLSFSWFPSAYLAIIAGIIFLIYFCKMELLKRKINKLTKAKEYNECLNVEKEYTIFSPNIEENEQYEYEENNNEHNICESNIVNESTLTENKFKPICITIETTTSNNKSFDSPNINWCKKISNEFIVIDTETTGLNPIEDKILEIAGLKYKDGQIIEQFSELINPEIHIPKKITQINNISNEMVKDCPTITSVLNKFIDFIGDKPLVAHNAKFDINFLNAKLACMDKFIQNDVIDTLYLSRKLFKTIPNHKLDTIREHLNINKDNSHRALPDCIACAEIYLRYCKTKKEKNNNISVPQNVINEKECYKIVKKILINNTRNVNYLRYSYTGKYFDIKAFYVFIRLKLNGKKQYVLSKKDKKELKNLNLQLETAVKSESGETRILITKPEDILVLENLILDDFDEAIKSMEYYRKNVRCANDNIENYLLIENKE